MKKVITYDELLDKIPNKYTLTITAGKRARDIGRGAPVLTKVSKKDTIVMKTFREILDGKITFGEQREEDLNEQE
ncbi:MAG: DNA-directed RNA polymerase subunit omega [Cetobacterium sp.]|uniref:DNA-directed RNA polymerase subunit omega n=1 Tax=Cetobacterium sp. TaxID=2071632 RepID=UPI002FCB11F8